MKLLSFLLSLNMLVSTTGINFHSHMCMQEDAQSGELILQDCHQQEKEASCCASKSDCGDEEDSCCTIEDNFIKKDIEALFTDGSELLANTAIVPVIELKSSHHLAMCEGSLTQTATGYTGLKPTPSALQVFRC